MSEIREAFSSPQGASDSPWGFAHNGIDFFTRKDRAPFVAAFPGRVISVEISDLGAAGFAVNVLLEFDEHFLAVYGFEPQSPGNIPLNTQLAFIRVIAGDEVERGQILGYLHRLNDASHVHFGLLENFTATCPEPFFTRKATNRIMKILRATWDRNVQMCY